MGSKRRAIRWYADGLRHWSRSHVVHWLSEEMRLQMREARRKRLLLGLHRMSLHGRWNRLGRLLHFELGAALLRAATSSIHPAIPPVLDSVVAAASQPSGNLSPPFPHLRYHLLNHDALFWRDGIVIQVGLQILVEPFTTLLGRTRLDGLRYPDPVVRAMEVDQRQQE